MSASDSTSSIFLTDTKNEIKKKINKYAFSGGQQTLEEHREKGGDTETDIAYQYLRFFLEDDDELAELGEKYRKGETWTVGILARIILGELLSGEMKARCIEVLQELVAEHQERRAGATDEVVQEFWRIRKLKYDYPDPPKVDFKSDFKFENIFQIEPAGAKKKQKQRGGAKNQKWAWWCRII